MEAEIHLPFRAQLLVDEAGFSYLAEVENSGCYASSVGLAKKKLREKLQTAVKEALDATSGDHWQKVIYQTISGEVFLVEYKYSQWQYSIYGPGRNGHSSCLGWDTLKEALERAESHINSSFGGVAWKCN